MSGIFLGVPTYNGWLSSGCAAAAYAFPSEKYPVTTMVSRGSSLLNGNCNWLLARALNGRVEHQWKWFALLHADIAPEMWFLDKLIDEAEKHGADMLSACIAIKDHKGVTSTAIGSGKLFGQVGRLTFAQLRHPDFPRTFDIDMAADALATLPTPLQAHVPRHALLANTGCMIVRLDKLWSDKLVFRSFDRMGRSDNDDYRNEDLSEDWYFSWRVSRLGGRVMCTTEVAAKHHGSAEFPNDRDWPNGIANECNGASDASHVINVVSRRQTRNEMAR